MPNTRIDDNGVPKGAVYEQTVPVLHREGIDEVDAGDPEPGDAIDTAGYEHADFDLDVTLGGDDPLLEVTALYYDATADGWFRGAPSYVTETGRYRVRTAARGARVFLAVTALEGESPTLDLDVWASLS